MRKAPLLLALLLVPLAMAATVDSSYDISQDAHVTHAVTLQDENLTIRLPPDAQSLTLDGEAVRAQGRITLIGNGTHTISYRTGSVLEADKHIVIDLAGVGARINQVRVTLPEDARLERPLTRPDPSVHPLPTSTRSDGLRHTLIWDGEALEPGRAVLITLERDSQPPLLLAAAIMLLFAGGLIALFTRRFVKRTDDLTRNLYGDERDLVRILDQAGGELWQKELQQRSGLSKVKVSRRMRSLEAKGVIQKIPHGNTNRIRLN